MVAVKPRTPVIRPWWVVADRIIAILLCVGYLIWMSTGFDFSSFSTSLSTSTQTSSSSSSSTSPLATSTGKKSTKTSSRLDKRKGKNCAPRKGIVVVSLFDSTEFNLLQAALGHRMADELCWDVVLRSHWVTGLRPHDQNCLPNISPNPETVPIKDLGIDQETWKAISFRPEELIESERVRNNELTQSWKNNIAKEEKVWDLKDVSEMELQKALTWIRDVSSKTQVVYLESYYLNYEWIENWRSHFQNLLEMKPTCCSRTPPKDAVLIHVQEWNLHRLLHPFGIDGNEYVRLLTEFHLQNSTVWIVLDSGHDNSPVAQSLLAAIPGLQFVHPQNTLDAVCIMSKAKTLVVTPSSITSSVAAALTNDATIHYPIQEPKSDSRQFSLAFPEWKYHSFFNGTFTDWDINFEDLDLA